MKKVVKVFALLYLGAQIERWITRLLAEKGLIEVDGYGNLRKSDSYDERITTMATGAVDKVIERVDRIAR